MNREWKDMLLLDDDEIYTEAKRRIEECGEKLSLTALDLYCPRLKALLDSFVNLKKLVYLNLGGVHIAKIPDSLGNCPLQYLELSGNFSTVPETLGNCAKLKVLNLNSDKPISLPKSLGGLSALKELYLVSPEIHSIPDSIGNCENLKLIIIESEKLTALPESFCELKNMEELRFDTFGLKALPSAFGSLASLKALMSFQAH